MIFSNPLFDSIKFYILVMLILIFIKPEFMYSKKNKKYKKLGYKKNQTLFTMPILSILIAIIIYIFVLLIHKLNSNKEKYISCPQYLQYIPYIPQISNIQKI